MAKKGAANRSTGYGKLLTVIRSNGAWVGVVQAFSSRPVDPVISMLVPISELKGSARRKADRWLSWLDAGNQAANS